MYYLASVLPVYLCLASILAVLSAFGAARRVFDSLRHPPELGTPIRFVIACFALHSLRLAAPRPGCIDGACSPGRLPAMAQHDILGSDASGTSGWWFLRLCVILELEYISADFTPFVHLRVFNIVVRNI